MDFQLDFREIDDFDQALRRALQLAFCAGQATRAGELGAMPAHTWAMREAPRLAAFLRRRRTLRLRKITKFLFEADDPSLAGSPPVGRGRDLMSALGNWVHLNRDLVGIELEVDASAQPAELQRRTRELAER